MTEEFFLDNPFYIALTKQFPDLYSKACTRKCIICIPRLSSLPTMKNGKHVSLGSNLIRRAELGLHILQPSPLQSHEEGLYDCVQKGYSVKIDSKKGVITGYSGFGRNFSARILSEERCYDEKSHGSFILLTIDHPLGEGMDLHSQRMMDLDYSAEKLTPASCETFLRDAYADQVLVSFKKAIEQIYRTYVLLEDYLDDLANKIYNLVTKAVEETLQIQPTINRKDVAAAFEIFGHSLLYSKLFPFIQTVRSSKEATILSNMPSIKKPEFIGGLNISTATYPTAQRFLRNVSSQTSPLQQLVFFSQATQSLQDDLSTFHRELRRTGRTQASFPTLSADDTLNFLIFIVASQRIPHLSSCLSYIEKFCWTIPDASLQYSLTTLEAVVHFLESCDTTTGSSGPLTSSASTVISPPGFLCPAEPESVAEEGSPVDERDHRCITPPNSQEINSTSGKTESWIDRKLRNLDISGVESPWFPSTPASSPLRNGGRTSHGSSPFLK